MKFGKIIIVFSLILAVCSCSDTDSEVATSNKPAESAPKLDSKINNSQLPEVLESFEVGKNVYVRSLKADIENKSLWVGTSVGVLEIDLASSEVQHSFTRADGLANEYVFAIGIDRLGYKWFGTNAGGVSRYKNGKWKTFFPMHGLADYWIYAFAEQKNGSFWIGTWAGANKVDLESMQFTTYYKELINEWVYAIDVDSKDRVWFGTEGGVSMLDGDEWSHWTHEDGMGAGNTADLPISSNTGLGTRSRHDLNTVVNGLESYNPDYVFALQIAQDDSVWVGTWGGGVAHFDGSNWTNLTVNDGLAGNIIYSIAQDDEGVLWFGTNHGLSRYDGQSWHNYGRHDGLLDVNVYAISITPDGNIWAGTRNGVTRLGYKQNLD